MNEQKFKPILRSINQFDYSQELSGRLFFGILNLRDSVIHAKYPDQEQLVKNQFDSKYTVVLRNLDYACRAKMKCMDLIAKYRDEIKQGQHIEDLGTNFVVKETIDLDLNYFYSIFFIKLRIALEFTFKACTILGFNYFFVLTEKDSNFQSKQEEAIKTYPERKDFYQRFESHRKWLMEIKRIRDRIIHDGGNLPLTQFDFEKKEVFVPPAINSMEILWSNTWEFIEFLLVYTFSCILPPYFRIEIVPEDQRDNTYPVKYKIGYNINIEDSPK